ncbi:MAG: 30S ribosomal protein S20 [Bdellovibrionales bacterium]|nr:30S ribosomal protein S20 [Bdellovibrionales bacterium]
MANHKSAAKRARQTVVKTARNSRGKSAVRTYEKNLQKALELGDKNSVQQLLVLFSSKAGKAAQKGVCTAKSVSRKIGRLSKQVHQLVSSK